MQTDRNCKWCGAWLKVWEFGVLWVSRSPEGDGWLNTQCPKCYSVGGPGVEATEIQEELVKLQEQKEAIVYKIHEMKTILRHIAKGTIMTEEQ